MSDIRLTAQQNQARTLTGRDILLTAAAGAGKTAVLARRCVYLLSEAPEPCEVEELLVLTFTESAAAEMRQRIADFLRKKSRQPGSDTEMLRRKLALLDKAQISTIHSFCKSVLSEFFYLLGLDPTFEMLDADEAALLKVQVAEELFERHYRETDKRVFSPFVQAYSSAQAGNDRNVVYRIVQMNNFLESLHDHHLWAKLCREQLEVTLEDPASLKLARKQFEVIADQLNRVILQLQYARDAVAHFPAVAVYRDYIDEKLIPNLLGIQQHVKSGDINLLIDSLIERQRWDNAPAIRKPKGLEEWQKEEIDKQKDTIKGFIDKAKDGFGKLVERFAVGPEALKRQLQITDGMAHLLLDLQGEFAAGYTAAKARRNVLDFADLEHRCLELLSPKYDVADQLRRRFRHVLVDEYQDTAPVQEAILNRICRGNDNVPGNVFMVGDVKQSIYGFRQADPRIFMRKYHDFELVLPEPENDTADLPDRARVNLNKNFRSRREIIAGINFIFRRCMTEQFCGIDYDDQAALDFGAEYYDNTAEKGAVEVHLLEKEVLSTDKEIDELDADRREALLIARRIQDMVQNQKFQVYDKQNDITRPVEYRDIVILLRSARARGQIWTETLLQADVPVYAELSGGYLGATEIQDMVSLLQLLDNPQQDIPLAAVLRSQLVGLDESELAEIRLASTRECPYYYAVVNYAENGADTALKEKLLLFLERLENWRSQARQGTLATLIWQIYRDTNLPATVSGLPDGTQRYNNLLHLYDRARQFDSFTRQGVSRFLRFLDKIRDEEGDFAPAPVITEAENVVRIMTVHKSKGLEFPVVIIADLARRFNTSDTRPSILFDSEEDCSVGLKVVDRLSHDRWDTLAHNIIGETLLRRSLAEEMRILYVALTRARERLILTGTSKLDDLRQLGQLWRWSAAESLAEFALSGVASPLYWLVMALAGHPDMQGFLERPVDDLTGDKYSAAARFEINSFSDKQMFELVRDNQPQVVARKSLENLDDLARDDNPGPAAAEVLERIKWRYAQRQMTTLAARTSVTEIKRHLNTLGEEDFGPRDGAKTEIAEPFSRRVRFLNQTGPDITAAERGTLNHLFLQLIDLSCTLDESGLADQLNEMVQRGIIDSARIDAVDLKKIAAFFADSAGRLLVDNPDRLVREWPFTLALPAAEVYTTAELKGTDAQEPVLVRGIIDCLVETDKGVWVIDYKTDRVNNYTIDQRAQGYYPQMWLYRRAVEIILHKPVCGLILYFLEINQAVQVPGLQD